MLGILLGIAVAQGAKAAIKGYVGVDIGAGLPVSTRTVLWSLAVGTVVTSSLRRFPPAGQSGQLQ